MSLYTVGEIVLWMILAALLGFGLGWLVRALVRPGAREGDDRGALPTRPAEDDRTRVEEYDTGESGTGAAPIDASSFAQPSAPDPVSEVARRTAGGLTPPRDDLVRIHGVGPKIAALLVAKGITSFRQVARMTPADVEILNDALPVFPGRIARDDWIGSARELHRQVYGVEP
jgi:predicted flap endonuclease-1-like 5' DNA nuclease